MLKDFSTQGFVSSVPSTACSQRDLRWICPRTKVASHGVSPCHPEGLRLPFWVTELAGLTRSSPEERTAQPYSSTQTLDLRRAGTQEAMLVSFMRSAIPISDFFDPFGGGEVRVVLTFKKKNSLTFKSPLTFWQIFFQSFFLAVF